MKTFFVDANAFLRFLLNDIPKQKKEFEQLLNKAKKSEVELIVPQIIIFEINFVLKKFYNFSKEEITDKLQSIVKAPYLKVQDREILLNAIKLYSKNNLSLTDCFLYAKAREEESNIFTFDKNLQKILKSV